MAETQDNGLEYLTLNEGARIGVRSTVYEDIKGGKKLHDVEGVKTKVQTRAELDQDGKPIRFVQVAYCLPFPKGFATDPVTKKPAEDNIPPAEFAKRIHQWMADLEKLIELGGRAQFVNSKGKMARGSIPVKYLPALIGDDGLLAKGFKLAIQGKANVDLVATHVTKVAGTKATKTTSAQFADVDGFGN